jgi:hypothetical protein
LPALTAVAFRPASPFRLHLPKNATRISAQVEPPAGVRPVLIDEKPQPTSTGTGSRAQPRRRSRRWPTPAARFLKNLSRNGEPLGGWLRPEDVRDRDVEPKRRDPEDGGVTMERSRTNLGENAQPAPGLAAALLVYPRRL